MKATFDLSQKIHMKLPLMVYLIFMAALFVSVNATAGDSVNLRVTGVIMPDACSPEISGHPQQPALKIECYKPRAVNIRWTEADSNILANTTRLRHSSMILLKRSVPSAGMTELEIFYL